MRNVPFTWLSFSVDRSTVNVAEAGRLGRASPPPPATACGKKSSLPAAGIGPPPSVTRPSVFVISMPGRPREQPRSRATPRIAHATKRPARLLFSAPG